MVQHTGVNMSTFCTSKFPKKQKSNKIKFFFNQSNNFPTTFLEFFCTPFDICISKVKSFVFSYIHANKILHCTVDFTIFNTHIYMLVRFFAKI